MKKRNCILMIVGLILGVGSAGAEPPRMMNYQGRLVENGTLVNSNNMAITLTIYNVSTGDVALYQENDSVNVVDGLYSTTLGDNQSGGSASNLANALITAGTNAWLGIGVGFVPEFSPRSRLLAAPFAMDSDTLDGQEGSYYTNVAARLGYTPVDKAGDTLSGDLNMAGNSITNGTFYGNGMGLTNIPSGSITLTGHNVTELDDVSSAGSGQIITSSERTKLNGIETNADVTDADNVAAAGAVMDSDFVSEGLMKRGVSSGTYSVVTDNSTNWNTAYGWGNHGAAGYGQASDISAVSGRVEVIEDQTSTWNQASANFSTHTNNTSNPHNVTKSQIGLNNVENTALSTWPGSTNLQILGMITNGEWQGTAIANGKIDSTIARDSEVDSATNQCLADAKYYTDTMTAKRVSTNRTISTSLPLSGGGSLDADLALSYNGSVTHNESGATNIPYSGLAFTDWPGTFDSLEGAQLVQTSRTINVTSPITGGGALDANRTIGFDGAVSFNASGATNLNGTEIRNGTIADARIASTIARDTEVNSATSGCLQANGTGLAGNFNLGGYYLSPDGTAKGLTLLSDGGVKVNYLHLDGWVTNASVIKFVPSISGSIYHGTTDGTDNKHIAISGGGSAESVTRGAYVYVAGNEDAYPGQIWLSAGNVANSKVVIATSNEQERLTVLQNGNVGIGTNTPASKLHVNGILQVDGNTIGLSTTEDSAVRPLTLDSNDNRRVYYCGGGVGDNGRGAYITMDGNESGVIAGAMRLYAGNDDSFSGSTKGSIIFYTSNNVQRVKIERAGNVGIGNMSAPARPLHVQDVMRLEPRATYPEGAAAGDIFYHSTSNKLYCYDGAIWQACF